MEKDRRNPQLGVDRRESPINTVNRRVYGEMAELPVGGGSVGNSGFTVFEARAIDAIAFKKRKSVNAGESGRGLFDLD